VAVGTVTTGAAGSSASVSNAGTSGAAVFNFTIPRGDTGATGATGPQGPAGGGGGGTKTLSVFTPERNQPPSTAFATLNTRNSILVLDFDDTTNESAIFDGVIPDGALLGSGLIVRVWWMATTATSNAVTWGVQFEKTGTDNDADSFDTAATGTSTANGTSGIETLTSITITTIDGLTVGDRFRLKVYRDASSAGDTMTGDAQLLAVEVRQVLDMPTNLGSNLYLNANFI
jgi:hypothetical protein